MRSSFIRDDTTKPWIVKALLSALAAIISKMRKKNEQPVSLHRGNGAHVWNRTQASRLNFYVRFQISILTLIQHIVMSLKGTNTHLYKSPGATCPQNLLSPPFHNKGNDSDSRQKRDKRRKKRREERNILFEIYF